MLAPGTVLLKMLAVIQSSEMGDRRISEEGDNIEKIYYNVQ